MYFMIQYKSGTNGAARSAHHPAHVEFRKALGNRVLIAGPLLPAEGDGNPVGSLIVIAAESLPEATEAALADPLCIHGAYELVSVTPFKPMVVNAPLPA